MITLTLTEEQLTAGLQVHLNSILDEKNYNNPIKSLLEKQIGGSYTRGILTDEIDQAITLKTREIMASPEFNTMLGLAIVQQMAKIQVEKMEKKNKY